MFPVHVNDPLLTFGRSWSGGLAPVQFATAPTFNGWVLARPAAPGLCTAPAPRPIRPKTRCHARLGKLFMINYLHN